MSETQKALRQHYRRNLDVPLLLAVAGATLALGLTLPILRVEKFVFWESGYSVITGVGGLFDEHEWLLGFIILFFSIVFPIAKLWILSVIWWTRMSSEQRFGMLRMLERLGRWSMLDVFAVAILVVAGKLGAVASVEARIGIYLFATAILMSMLATWRVKSLALRATHVSDAKAEERKSR